MKNFILILSVSLFSFVCLVGMHKSNDEKIVDGIIEDVSLKIYEKNGLVLCGTGAQMMNKIDMLGLYFDCEKQIKIEEARKLLVDTAEQFLNDINSNEKIRPYLCHYPFKITDIEIEIYTPPLKKANELAVVSIAKGCLVYENYDFSSLEVVFKETYQEGLQKLNLKAS